MCMPAATLPISPIATPVSGNVGGVATYEIRMQQFTNKVHRDLPPTVLWGYNGVTPGPVILASNGAPVTVRYSNSTGVPTIPDNDPARSGPRGIAIRFHLGEYVHTDLVAHSTNGFPVRTGDEFLEFLRATAAFGAGQPEALGAFLANVTTAGSVATSLGIAAGNTLEALTGAALLGLVGFRPSLERLRDVLALVALAACGDDAGTLETRPLRSDGVHLRDAEGRVAARRAWSDPAALRRDLEGLCGPVENPTSVEDVQLKTLPPPEIAAKGVVPRLELPGDLRPLRVSPQMADEEQPFYAKLRAEGLRASLLNKVVGVDTELQRFVAKYVKRELSKPAVLAARTIDVLAAVEARLHLRFSHETHVPERSRAS